MEGCLTLSTLLLLLGVTAAQSFSSPWTFTCDKNSNLCIRERLQDGNPPTSLEVCSLTCPPSTVLWPLPANYTLGPTVTVFNLQLVSITIPNGSPETQTQLQDAVIRQKSMLGSKGTEDGSCMTPLSISVVGQLNTEMPSVGMDETYSLEVTKEIDSIKVEIKAATYFGARHAIETVFQMADFDPFTSSFVILDTASIYDKPFFPHRGVLLDTSRNFIPVPKIKEMLDSMSYSKLNVFHWHLTDSQSFPIQMELLPEFSRFGAYRPNMVYTKENVLDILEYAASRGVIVIPELDAPAHVGAGWQSVDDAFVVCLEKEPWEQFCLEPPCGQLNPTAPGMFDVLEKIHKEFLNLFRPSTLHMGGDEVHFGCWNSSDVIVNWLAEKGKGRMEEDFLFLWDFFQQESLQRVMKASLELEFEAPKATLWSSHLTLPQYISYLNPDLYNIQFWVDSTDVQDPTIKTVAEAGFKMIFSNSDATYLDCGYQDWLNDGNNWCSPYKGWQTVYENDPYSIIEKHGVSNQVEAEKNILGGEVAMWTEQTDDMSLMSKVEPRAAAYAERLWRGPSAGKWREAESRMVRHRERLRERGIGADALVHRWCNQNQGKCVLPEA